MRFLSNFGGKIIFMCSVNFWRQEPLGRQSSTQLFSTYYIGAIAKVEVESWYSLIHFKTCFYY